MSTKSWKHILVTGGNTGIGKATCEQLLRDWPDTAVLLGSRNVERGQKAVDEIRSALGSDTCSSERLECLPLDITSDESVQAAAAQFATRNQRLYGIVNNAGIGMKHSKDDMINTNYFGPRRVNDAFAKFLIHPGGRIVNVSSAAGPYYIAGLLDGSPAKRKLAQPWTMTGGLAELDALATSVFPGEQQDAYGRSKALLNAYTWMHAKLEPDLVINSCTPGFIATQLTAGAGAVKPPSDGAIPLCFLLMDPDIVQQPSGRYYGSDCVRSPFHVYRGPGDPPYVSDDDLVDWNAVVSTSSETK